MAVMQANICLEFTVCCVCVPEMFLTICEIDVVIISSSHENAEAQRG